MAPDLVIRNARIVTSNGTVEGDLAVQDGRIADIGDVPKSLNQEIDANGMLLLPGGIDTHCHMAQRPVNNEPPCPDDFRSGTAAAAAGGITTVIPFSMCPRGSDPEVELREYLAQAEGQALIDYSVHVQLARADPAFLSDVLPRLADEGFTSLKLFTTYEGYMLSDIEILKILDVASKLDLLCLIHAEDDALIRYLTEREVMAGRTELTRQPIARPIECEAAAIRRLSDYAAVTGARIHIFHVSGSRAIQEIDSARARGIRISGETCAHYVSFSADDLARPIFEGAKFLCSPALRSAADHDDLWQALADGRLSTWSSDHSPSHRTEQIARAKAGESIPFTNFSGGIPGIQTMLPVLFSEGVVKGRLSLQRFAELTSSEPARLFGLASRKGQIRVGADADLVLWNPDAVWTVRHSDMLSHVDFTPWEGVRMTGRPIMTLSRGRIVAQNGKVNPDLYGHGCFLPRNRTPT